MVIRVLFLAIFAVNAYAQEQSCGKESLNAQDTTTKWNVSASPASGATQCQYNINGVEGKFVMVTFQEFIFKEEEQKAPCEKHYVKLESIVNDMKIEIAHLCEPPVNKAFYSPGSKMIVTIGGKQAFNATYQSVASVESLCGESEMNAETDESNVWNAPTNALEDNKICVYSIKAKPGEVVELTFKNIANPPQMPLNIDETQTYIRLENLKDGRQTPIANISVTGTEIMQFNSTEEIMIITLYGRAGYPHPLFSAVYKSVTHPICGPAVLKADEGTSPDWHFPLKALDSDRNCTYTIQAGDSQTVQLNITKVDVENMKNETPCKAPYIQIAESVNGLDETIKNICDNKEVRHSVSSTASGMKVTLHGLLNLKEKAVTATYRAVVKPATDCGADPKAAKETEQSFDIYTKSDNIPKGHTCTWTITAPENKNVDVYLKVEEGASENQCVLVQGKNEQVSVPICRKTNSNLATSIQPVTVKFEGPDTENAYTNFKVYYKLTVESAVDCGEAPKPATEVEQWIDVYTKPDEIPPSHKCTWTITAPRGKKVDVYLNNEEGSVKEQCVVVTGANEQEPETICRTSSNNMATKTQPVTVKFDGPGKENLYKNFKIYYKVSFANHIVSSFTIILLLLFVVCL